MTVDVQPNNDLRRSPAAPRAWGRLAVATLVTVLVSLPLGGCRIGGETGSSHDHGSHPHVTVDVFGGSDTTSSDVEFTASDYEWNLPAHVPEPVVPAGNPMTAEKVALGRHLFYDERLSGNETQSCATCHVQAIGFSDDLETAIGSTGAHHPRNSQTLTNVAFNASLTWASPLFLDLETQIILPLTGDSPVELGVSEANQDAVFERFRSDPLYQTLFAEAFPDDDDPVNLTNIVFSLASFSRTILCFDSPYDRGEMSDAARRGQTLFNGETAECFHCHTGFNFSNSTRSVATAFASTPFMNTGLYNVNGEGAYPEGNQGLFETTENPAHRGMFRPPTLRNIALTAPYMHDGSIETLEEVVDFYAAGGRHIEEGPNAGDGRTNPYKDPLIGGFDLTEDQKADLVAFLHALTDDGCTTRESLSNPFE